MKYPIILKYNYSYIISGNYYKIATRDYYQLFENKNTFKMLSLGSSTDIMVNIEKYSENEIEFSYRFSRYLYPGKFVDDTEWINYTYTLKPGEKVSMECVYKYWAYASGAENGPANLVIEWISYEDMIKEIIKEAEKDKYKAIESASILIKEEMYDIAFNILSKTNTNSYELGLCYEKGYGTTIDLDKALDIYLNVNRGYEYASGIERIYKARGEDITFDDIKKTVILESKGYYQRAYATAIIPTKNSNNKLEDMKRNVELSIIKFLEEGYPFNSVKDMHKLVQYYDMINNVPEDEQPKYHTIEYEEDPYDGGHFRHDIYHYELIVNTLQKEGNKNDIGALGCLLVQYGINPIDSNFSSYYLNNIEEIKQRLLDLGEKGNEKESGMSYFFLGLYYERMAKKAKANYDRKYYINDKKYTYDGENIEKDTEIYFQENNIDKEKPLIKIIDELCSMHNYLARQGKEEQTKELENYIIHLYNKNYEYFSKLEKENLDQANKYYELSLAKGFHLAVAHITDKILAENTKEEAIKILEQHKDYIPTGIKYSCAEKYFTLLEKLKNN